MYTERSTVRVLAWFALAAQLVFVLAWIVAGALEDGYSHAEQGVSELGARVAENAWIANGALVLLGLSLAALGPGLLRTLPRRGSAAVAAAFFALAGLGFVLAGLLPVDCWGSVDRACEARQDAGDLSFEHYAHLWLALLCMIALAVTPFAIARSLWPRPAAVAALAGGIGGLLTGIASILLWEVSSSPGGLIQRVGLAQLHLWVLLVAGGILYATRRPPRLPEPTPLPPRDFYGRSWEGEGEYLLQPFFLWRRFAPRFRALREVTWLTDEAWIVEDRAEFGGGHVETRRFLCELAAPDHVLVTATELLEPADVWIEPEGYRVAPYRARIAIGPVGVPLVTRDNARLEDDGTIVNTLEGRLLGVPVLRVVTRARRTDA